MSEVLSARSNGPDAGQAAVPGSHVPSTSYGHARAPIGRSYDNHVTAPFPTNNSFPAGSNITAAFDPKTHAPIRYEAITGETIVRVDGIGEMSFDIARQNGFVDPLGQVGSEGPFKVPLTSADEGEGSGDNNEGTEEDVHPELQAEWMANEDAEEAMTLLVHSVAPGTTFEAVAELSSGAAEISEGVLAAAAGQSGMEPGELSQHIATAREGLTQQAEDTIRSEIGADLGLDMEAFWEWAWSDEAASKTLQEAISDQLTKGTTHNYKRLASTYAANLDRISPDSILNAEFGEGVSAHKDRDGKILISKDGKTLGRWADLYNAGFLKLSKKAAA